MLTLLAAATLTPLAVAGYRAAARRRDAARNSRLLAAVAAYDG